MSRNFASPHRDIDSLLTGRVIPLHLRANDDECKQPRQVREDDLCMRQHERATYRDIAVMSRRYGVADVLAERMAQCRGASCRQGRVECRENCNPPPEMACAAPEDEARSFREWLADLYADMKALFKG